MPPLRIVPLGPDPVGYEDAWEQQRRLHAAVADGIESDTVLLLEHPPVYTAGRRTEPGDRPTDGTPVVDVDRGGRITWHGPGQLVGYPIVRLGEPVDVVAHVRRLEEVLIRTCADLGLATERVAGRSGVWVPADDTAPSAPRIAAGIGVARPGRPERKVAAVGVRVSRGVTMHGFALNCDCDLTWFDRIVPCGIADAGVTSLTAELGRRVTVAEALPLVRGHLAEVFGPAAAPRTPGSAADAVRTGPA
ncbi:MAG: lipoyl(octanoyl) transferase LipB [Candidatus Nanopelagicales bacterium]